MEVLTNVVNKTIATLDHIKSAIVRNGVEVPEGSSTATYGEKINEVFEAGVDSVAPDIDEQIQRLSEEIEGAEEGSTMREQIIQEQHDIFWDAIQNLGEKRKYGAVFQSPVWTNENFKPKYDIYPDTNTFCDNSESNLHRCSIEDMRASTLGVNINWSLCQNFNYILRKVPIKYIDIIDMSNAVYGWCLLFNANKLESVEKIILPPQSANIAFKTHGFQGLTNLKEIRFEGYFYGSVEIKNSKLLSHDSIISIINALSPDISDVTLTLHLNAVNKAFETSEGANDGSTSNEWLALIATRSNWTISLNP